MVIQKRGVPRSAILPYTASAIRRTIQLMPDPLWDNLEEIRMGASRPLAVYTAKQAAFLTAEGQATSGAGSAYICTKDDIDSTLQLAAQNSIYAVSDKLKCGYITIPGGHRVGVTGTAVLQNDTLVHIKDVSAVNIRIAHAVPGAADAVLPAIQSGGALHNTMIIGPPQSGKTTLLRDIARQLGNTSIKVGLVDERGEIAAMCSGVPQQEVGARTDVLDFCPKSTGMPLLVRSMSPDVIITDEIGMDADAYALMQVLGCGVNVIASAHGLGLPDVMDRPFFKDCIRRFDVIIEISRRNGTGTVERVLRRGNHDF